MIDRTAIDTIVGYFYQFDHTIQKLLETQNGTDTILVEGVEDIDIKTATEETAIQCKYYDKSEYNHSVIAKPIRFMLSHYKEVIDGKQVPINYSLYGHFKSGQDKLKVPIDITFLKEHLLTYTKDKVKIFYHTELGLTDAQLDDFIKILTIDINAMDYESQLENILALLKKKFKCSDFEAEHYYYNNALSVIKTIASQQNEDRRRIIKDDFLNNIDKKSILFNKWFVTFKGKETYLRNLRRQYFTDLNASPFERFFLIEAPTGNYDRAVVKELLFIISKKWSKLSRRAPKPFCPYVYLHNIATQELIAIKKELLSEGFNVIDGFDFQGADFNELSIIRTANSDNQIKLKIVNEIAYLKQIFQATSKTKIVYQFYISNIFFSNIPGNIRTTHIQIEDLKDIKEII